MEYCSPAEVNSQESCLPAHWKTTVEYRATTSKAINQQAMEYHSSCEVNSQNSSYQPVQWKPAVDYSVTCPKAASQQISETNVPAEMSSPGSFSLCQSKPPAENPDPACDPASSKPHNKQEVSDRRVPCSGSQIYSSEDSDDDICAARLRKTTSILEALFSDDSIKHLGSASDTDKALLSDTSDESEPAPVVKKSPKTVSASLRPKAGRGKNTLKSKSKGTISVNTCQRKSDGKRLYNKKHYCFFCSKPFGKMARHLEHVHSKEEDVVKACSFPKRSKERRLHLDEIRHRGNYKHNITVLKLGKGDLIPYKRPRGAVKPSDFMHCAHCQGLFTKKVLWRHMKVCKQSPKDHVPKPGKNRALSLCAAAQPAPPNVSPELWTTLSVMVQDEITEAVKYDHCIIQLADYWLKKSGNSLKNQGFIRQKLRELGKLLISGRKVTSLREMEDFIDPYNCMQAVEAVRHACEYNRETNSYRIPYLAKKLAIWLVQLSKLVRTEVVIPKSSTLRQKLCDFKKIHEERWNSLLCTTVSASPTEVKWKKPTLLAFTEDVMKLYAFLNKTRDEYMAKVSAEPSSKHWSDLAKVALTQVVLFNRSREEEVSSMTLNTFLDRDSTDPPIDIDWALTRVEKQFCRHFYKIVVRREGSHPVPVLLTLKMLHALQFLTEKRELCGVQKDNMYVFARPLSTTHYRGSDSLRVFAVACEAKDPYSLKCGKLRKRVATLSTVLNLGDPEISQLANFLGHELIVHEEYYPLPERALQLAKVYKVLTAMEQGRMMEFMGKNFSDVTVQPDEEVELSDDRGRKSWECSATKVFFPDSQPPKRMAHKKRQTWSAVEIAAVERHLMDFITSCRVPGKNACENCIRSETEALKNRDWQSIKFYVYNRIMAQKREGGGGGGGGGGGHKV